MKKNLFLLFSVYFFVVQAVIAGILRWETNFFWLAGINFLAIMLIALLPARWESTFDKEKTHEPKTVYEPKVGFHETTHSKREKSKQKELVVPTIVSLLVALGIFLIFQTPLASPELMGTFALSIGFIVFVSLTLIWKHRITKKFWKLIWTRLYIVVLLISVAMTAYDYYQVQQTYDITIQDYIWHNFLGQEIIPSDDYLFTGQGTVLGSGMESTWLQDISTDILSGMISNSDVIEQTWNVLETSTDTANNTPATTIGNQKLMDAVIYLLEKYDIPMVTKQDISFSYVTTKNPYYAQWRTAYANKMIGKTTNPSKYIVCESYIVMKWLLEKRPVVYTSTTVLDKFRAEAVKRDALNGCVKGKIVTDKTL